jgi:glycine hydroxymethyltransferase
MAQVFVDRDYHVVSGGTDNHLMLVSLVKQDITGKDAEEWLGKAHITANKNAVPNDPRSPFVTSGLRIGTPAATTRGFGEDDVRQIATWICDVLDTLAKGGDIEGEAERVRKQVNELCARYPVYRTPALGAA